jgi:hypothetical protein
MLVLVPVAVLPSREEDTFFESLCSLLSTLASSYATAPLGETEEAYRT